MGTNQISEPSDAAQMRTFVRALLEDVHALERMLAEGRFERDVRRVGAEQEMFLVDRSFRPSASVLQVLERLGGQPFTTELAQFNLEANMPPLEFTGDCLGRMERTLEDLTQTARRAAAAEQVQVLLAGILPTLDRSHLGLEWMTPIPRYHQLNRMMTELRGGTFKTLIKGLDELQIAHDNVMLEACNTSFQVHFQVTPDEFARLYNLAQAVTAPVLAAACNSPLLLGHRLWHETRVALFQQSVDTRSDTQIQRGTRTRVSFGDRWVTSSILEIYRDDVARFRSLIAIPLGESPMAMLDRGEVPPLAALRLHNGTIYRWNRPCYGISEGKAHLRIENRVLPAGPSVRDQVANAAFYFGLMSALSDEVEDVTRVMAFDDAKTNFFAAARYGLDARLRWFDGKPLGADRLILDVLLPRAEAGLRSRGIRSHDVDLYLGVVRDRVASGRTGAQWMLDSLAAMEGRGRPPERMRALAREMVAQQEAGRPVHEWPLAGFESAPAEQDSFRTIGQIMTSDVFTVHPEDLVDLAASLMEWEHLRYVPVENREGRLVGLLSHRQLLRLTTRGSGGDERSTAVRDLMITEPITVTPWTSTLEAIEVMDRHQIGCLPVVDDGKLVGIVTEHDFMEVSRRLLERWLREG
jgi:CBS domain-containing protein/gamma-glutamyl:cysteine ligase YbdK (ATP-grasp superfamily)